MPLLALEAGRLALIIGKVRQTCQEEAAHMDKLLRPMGLEERISAIWSLAAVESALHSSFKRVIEVSQDILQLEGYEIPDAWHPDIQIRDMDQLLDSWLEEMDLRGEVLKDLYFRARALMLSSEVGQDDLGDLHLDIDDLKQDD